MNCTRSLTNTVLDVKEPLRLRYLTDRYIEVFEKKFFAGCYDSSSKWFYIMKVGFGLYVINHY